MLASQCTHVYFLLACTSTSSKGQGLTPCMHTSTTPMTLDTLRDKSLPRGARNSAETPRFWPPLHINSPTHPIGLKVCTRVVEGEDELNLQFEEERTGERCAVPAQTLHGIVRRGFKSKTRYSGQGFSRRTRGASQHVQTRGGHLYYGAWLSLESVPRGNTKITNAGLGDSSYSSALCITRGRGPNGSVGL